MVESKSLQLALSAAQVSDLMARQLSDALIAKGYEGATSSVLTFLSTLECGVNYGAEIARNLGVSRQMVAKTIKQLCQLGYLEQIDDVGKQKKILFTERGEYLMSDARKLLADMDSLLQKRLGARSVGATIDGLHAVEAELKKSLDSR